MVNWFDPITRKRLQRFREYKRAYYSLLIIVFLYITSLGAELICNDRPLYVHYEDKSYFPVLFFYPENTFTGNGLLTRPDYKTINDSPAFAGSEDNFMIFPLVPFGPQEITKASSIPVDNQVEIHVQREPRVASVNIDINFIIHRQQRAEWFFRQGDTAIGAPIEGLSMRSFYTIAEPFIEALKLRFANKPAVPYSTVFPSAPEAAQVELSLSPYKPRSRSPDTVRVLLREGVGENLEESWLYTPEDGLVSTRNGLWNDLTAKRRDDIRNRARARLSAPVGDLRLEHDGINYRIKFIKEDVRFPFRPVGPHLFGLDDTGRDVLARIFYGLRISLNFGLLLVVTSMVIGTIIGAVQGYYGGKFDLTGQRLTEIWEALPFLYVLILLGSVYGSSFTLLLIVYGLFNWIGISYYMRAEFLRLRNQQFVEAAQCLGLPDRKILFRHILPNALVPLTTFFPFSLVGAIGTLAALDYLGFGLPPPTASWGQLLAQAQGQAYWWLILYPSLALFLVILLCVFIGEGVRNAFDPRKFTRLE